MNGNKQISGGIYLVVDPSMNKSELLGRLFEILKEDNIAAVQIWDNFPASEEKVNLVEKICALCHKNTVPVFVNNEWQLLNSTNADGVHFDKIPINLDEIRAGINKECLIGITCNNDPGVIKWADENDLTYISFCSVFPSSTSNSCELVDFETIREARKITAMPIFLAGGIKPGNIRKLKDLDFQGVAVISGIMNSRDPVKAAKEYDKELKQSRNENINHK